MPAGHSETGMNDRGHLSIRFTLAQVQSHLWEAANILRGSPVDRPDWKSYILPLLFFKRVCDCWDEEHAEMVARYGEAFADEHRYLIKKFADTTNKKAGESYVSPATPEQRSENAT